MLRGQLFDNTVQGGLFLALPLECLPSWQGAGPMYRELCLLEDCFSFAEVGGGLAVFMAGPEGDIIHEARFLRDASDQGVILAGWNEWDDNREAWFTRQLRRKRLSWLRHPRPMELASGSLVLLHAEGSGLQAVHAPTNRPAVCGEYLSIALSPGEYFLETIEFEQRPEGNNCCEACRWVPVGSASA